MQFAEKNVFVYDQRRQKRFSFSEVVAAYSGKRSKVPSDFALSGLDDLANSLYIIEEYYNRNFPHIDFKELRRGVGQNPIKVDPLYNEPASLRREFSRVIQVPAYVSQEDKTTKLAKQGAQTNHVVEFCTGMVNLFRLNYFPEIGDEVVWLGTLYQIGEVIFKKDHLHQNTGFPLHVTMKCAIQQWGDEKFPTTLTSTNTIQSQPQSNIAPVGHRIPVIKFDK